MYRGLTIATVMTAILLALPACTTMAQEKKEAENEKDEVKVKLDQVPAAVQATLKEEAKGATIDQVDKESDNGKTVYEADVAIKGKNYEIKVLEDGTLLSKKLDQEDEKGGKDEKKEKDEKDEKDEKGEKK